MLPGVGARRAAQLVALREKEERITLPMFESVLHSQLSDRLLSLIDFGDEGVIADKKSQSHVEDVPSLGYDKCYGLLGRLLVHS